MPFGYGRSKSAPPVNDGAVKRLVGGLSPNSTGTRGYCQARARLPLTVVSTVARQAGEITVEGAATWWHWRGRRGVDGLLEQYGVRKRSTDFSKGGLNHWSGHFTRFPEKMRHITRKKVDWTALESGKSQVIKDILFLA